MDERRKALKQVVVDGIYVLALSTLGCPPLCALGRAAQWGHQARVKSLLNTECL